MNNTQDQAKRAALMEQMRALLHSAPSFDSEQERIKTLNQINEKWVKDYNNSTGNLTGYDCPVCRNKGNYMMVTKESEIHSNTTARCSCMTKRTNAWRIENSGLSEIIDSCRFSNFDDKEPWQQQIKQSAIAYANNPQGWYYIGGQVGSGKTHLCTAISAQLMRDGHQLRYINWRDELMDIKMQITDGYSDKIKRLQTIDSLYIDDLFKTANQPTAADIQITFEILNYRYNNNLITIISSEKTIDEIMAIDEAIGSRIYQKAKQNTINIAKDKTKNYRTRR